MGSSWYLDETEISSYDPGHSSPDSLSFNGKLFNYPAGSMSSLAEKGVVYVDSDPEEDDDLNVPDSTCGGHGILVRSDPKKTTFQIVNTRIHDENKHVIYCVMVLKKDVGIDKDKVTVERRYSDFAALYKTLRKDLSSLFKDIEVNFPGKVIGQKNNLNPELIESRRMALQDFLQNIFKHKEVRQQQAFKEFFFLPGLREATDSLKAGELENCLELFLNSIHLQVKLCDEVRETVATFGAIVVVLEAQGKLEDAERYARAALELNHDDYLSPYAMPLLDTLAKLRRILQMEKKTIVRHLSELQRMSGIEVEDTFTLRELAVKRFEKVK